MKIILILLITALIIISGCNITGQVISSEQCDQLQDLNDKDDCFAQSAKTKKDITICENIEHARTIQYCYQ